MTLKAKDVIPAGAVLATYPAAEVEQELTTFRRHRLRVARVIRGLHRGVHRGRPRLRHRRIHMLRHLSEVCRTPASLSLAVNMPDRAGITDPRERDMLKRLWQHLQQQG